MAAEKRNEEIDLIELFFRFYVFIKRNFWILTISTIIGVGLGYSVKFMSKEFYESDMIIESYTLPADLLIEYINGFKENITEDSYSFISKITELDEKDLKDIIFIEAEYLIDEKKRKIDEIEYIKVTARSNDKLLFNNLSKGILKYLESKEYINQEIELFIEQNKTLISKIENEISQVDEIQNTLSNPKYAKTDVSIYTESKSIENELVELLKQKLDLEKEIKFAHAFRIIEDFSIYEPPVIKTVTYSISGGALFGFLAFLILAIRSLNKKISKSN